MMWTKTALTGLLLISAVGAAPLVRRGSGGGGAEQQESAWLLDEDVERNLASWLRDFEEASLPPTRPTRPPRTSRPTRAPTTPRPSPAPVTSPPRLTKEPTRPPRLTKEPSTAVTTEAPTVVLVLGSDEPSLSPTRSVVSETEEPTPAPDVTTTPVPTRSVVGGTEEPTQAPDDDETTPVPTVALPSIPTAPTPSDRPIDFTGSFAPGVPTTPSPTAGPGDTLMDLVLSNPDLQILASALQTAKVDTAIRTTDGLTLFAPNAEAFAKLDSDYLTTLLEPEYRLHLTYLLRNHATANVLQAADLVDGFKFPMLTQEITTAINNASGVFLQTYASALELVAEPQVIEADLEASNGVLHVVDTVLTPPWFYFDFVDVIVNFQPETLQSLLSLVASTGLEEQVRSWRGYTLLAPSNSAIEALPQDLSAYLLANPEELVKVLTYHVIPTIVNTATFNLGVTPTPTLEGSDVRVGIFSGENNLAVLTFDDATAQNAFLTQYNIIYVIDQVLIPPDFVVP